MWGVAKIFTSGHPRTTPWLRVWGGGAGEHNTGLEVVMESS